MIRIFHIDRWLNGFIAGTFIPVLLFAGMIILFESLGVLSSKSDVQTIHLLRPRTLALISLCFNILMMQTFAKLRWNQSMRGMAIATFICVVVWIAKYGKEIF